MLDHQQCLDNVIAALGLDLSKVMDEESSTIYVSDDTRRTIDAYARDVMTPEEVCNLVWTAPAIPEAMQMFSYDHETPADEIREMAGFFIDAELVRLAALQPMP